MQIAYRSGDSFLHKVDPIMKFLWLLIVATWLYSLRDIILVSIVSMGTAVFAVLGAKLELQPYLKLAVLAFISSGFLVLYHGIFQQGPGISVGPIVLSYEGIELGLAIGLRVFGIVAASLAFSVSTSPQDLTLALVKIGVSYKLAHICYLSLRLLPIFQRDMQTIQDIQRLRGAERGWNRLKTSIIALLACELRQVDNITIALETRGFGLHKSRTELRQVTINARGIALVLSTFILIVCLQVFKI